MISLDVSSTLGAMYTIAVFSTASLLSIMLVVVVPMSIPTDNILLFFSPKDISFLFFCRARTFRAGDQKKEAKQTHPAGLLRSFALIHIVVKLFTF